MDEDRQIRFLIPPFFLYASLLWWAVIDPRLHCSLVRVTGHNLTEILSIIAAAGAATIPLGYSIGTLALLLRKGFFRFKSSHRLGMTDEAWVSDECFQIILRETQASKDTRESLYPIATFDHELLTLGVHEWIVRRWNSFNVALNSALAILVSLTVVFIRRAFYSWPFDPYCGGTESQWLQAAAWDGRKWWWLGINLFLLGMLLWGACKSWRETMGMIEFQSRRRMPTNLRTESSLVPQARDRGMRTNLGGVSLPKAEKATLISERGVYLMPATTYSPTHFRVQYNRPCGFALKTPGWERGRGLNLKLEFVPSRPSERFQKDGMPLLRADT